MHGQQILALTDQSEPYTILDPAFKKKAYYHKSNQTYEVTDFVHGIMPNLFVNELARNLNFTPRVYKRKDGVWGTIQNNVSTGIFKNIVDGDVEMSVAEFAILRNRMDGVNFLPTIILSLMQMVTKKEQPESVSWTLLFVPFSLELWVMIVSVAFVIATWLFLLNDGLQEFKTGVRK